MNRHTFKDVVKSKRSSLANELDEDDDEVDRAVAPLKRAVEGEEDDGDDKFNEAGEVLEAFNLRDERDGGFFDENMNYVFKKEKGEVDAWVAEMDEVAMEQAIGEAARAVKRKAAEREKEEEREAQKEFVPSIRLKQQLLSHMKPKETVSGAMRRLSGKNDVADKGEGIVRRRAPPAVEDHNNSNNRAVAGQGSLQKQKEKLQQQRDARAQQSRIHQLTELADELLSRGLTGVYSMSYEALRASTLMWEYKGLTDGQVHGPYTAQQLAGWKAQGYFAGPTAVQVRAVGENHLSDMQATATSTAAVGAGVGDAAAQAALRAFGVHTKAAMAAAPDNDSIYDDDIVDTTAKALTPAATTTAAAAATAVAGVWADWITSDEVNFGEYVNLDQAQEAMRQPQRKQPRTTVHTYEKDNSGNGSNLRATSSSSSDIGSNKNNNDDHEEDEEEEAEEAEGMSYRRSKPSARKTKDLPDSDDDDE